jgi:hypothetical protein
MVNLDESCYEKFVISDTINAVANGVWLKRNNWGNNISARMLLNSV